MNSNTISNSNSKNNDSKNHTNISESKPISLKEKTLSKGKKETGMDNVNSMYYPHKHPSNVMIEGRCRYKGLYTQDELEGKLPEALRNHREHKGEGKGKIRVEGDTRRDDEKIDYEGEGLEEGRRGNIGEKSKENKESKESYTSQSTHTTSHSHTSQSPPHTTQFPPHLPRLHTTNSLLASVKNEKGKRGQNKEETRKSESLSGMMKYKTNREGESVRVTSDVDSDSGDELNKHVSGSMQVGPECRYANTHRRKAKTSSNIDKKNEIDPTQDQVNNTDIKEETNTNNNDINVRGSISEKTKNPKFLNNDEENNNPSSNKVLNNVFPMEIMEDIFPIDKINGNYSPCDMSVATNTSGLSDNRLGQLSEYLDSLGGSFGSEDSYFNTQYKAYIDGNMKGNILNSIGVNYGKKNNDFSKDTGSDKLDKNDQLCDGEGDGDRVNQDTIQNPNHNENRLLVSSCLSTTNSNPPKRSSTKDMKKPTGSKNKSRQTKNTQTQTQTQTHLLQIPENSGFSTTNVSPNPSTDISVNTAPHLSTHSTINTNQASYDSKDLDQEEAVYIDEDFYSIYPRHNRTTSHLSFLPGGGTGKEGIRDNKWKTDCREGEMGLSDLNNHQEYVRGRILESETDAAIYKTPDSFSQIESQSGSQMGLESQSVESELGVNELVEHTEGEPGINLNVSLSESAEHLHSHTTLAHSHSLRQPTNIHNTGNQRKTWKKNQGLGNNGHQRYFEMSSPLSSSSSIPSVVSSLTSSITPSIASSESSISSSEFNSTSFHLSDNEKVLNSNQDLNKVKNTDNNKHKNKKNKNFLLKEENQNHEKELDESIELTDIEDLPHPNVDTSGRNPIDCNRNENDCNSDFTDNNYLDHDHVNEQVVGVTFTEDFDIPRTDDDPNFSNLSNFGSYLHRALSTIDSKDFFGHRDSMGDSVSLDRSFADVESEYGVNSTPSRINNVAFLRDHLESTSERPFHHSILNNIMEISGSEGAEKAISNVAKSVSGNRGFSLSSTIGSSALSMGTPKRERSGSKERRGEKDVEEKPEDLEVQPAMSVPPQDSKGKINMLRKDISDMKIDSEADWKVDEAQHT